MVMVAKIVKLGDLFENSERANGVWLVRYMSLGVRIYRPVKEDIGMVYSSYPSSARKCEPVANWSM